MTVDRKQFRDSRRYRVAVASEVVAPVLRIVARAVSRSAAASPSQWRTGVIFGNGHIGDVLYRTCSLDLLKRGLPDCEWSYVTTPSAAEALTNNPSLAAVLPWSLDADTQALAPGWHRHLAERRFDVALCSENVAHHHALLLALKLGIPNRVAFTQKGLSGLVTEAVQLPESMSRPAQFRYLVRQITRLQDTAALRPRLFPSVSDTNAAESEWARLKLNDAEFVIACSVTTRQTIGDFPPGLFIDILRRALDIAPAARVVLAGSAGDRPLLNSMAQELDGRAAVSAGVLSVLGYGAMLQRCAVFIGADSGPRHLANAAGIPVFFVRNMGTSEIEAGAYCPTETDIAPAGEYLSPNAMRSALDDVDRYAVATALVSAARLQLRDKAEGTPP